MHNRAQLSSNHVSEPRFLGLPGQDSTKIRRALSALYGPELFAPCQGRPSATQLPFRKSVGGKVKVGHERERFAVQSRRIVFVMVGLSIVPVGSRQGYYPKMYAAPPP